MTLIEVLLEYQRIFRKHGKTQARKWLHSVCDHSLWDHVEDTFNRKGDFVDADGLIICNIDAEVW